jgi:hypothetical protein
MNALTFEDAGRLTKPRDIPPTDERAGKRQKRLMHVYSPLIDLQ